MCSSQVPDTWLEEEGLLLTGLKVQHGCIAIEGRAWSTGFSSVRDRRCKENSKEESKTTHSRQGHSPRHIIPLPSESQAHSTCLWKSIRSQTLTALPRSLPPVVPASVFLILLPRLYAWPETRPRLSSVKILGSFYVTCNPGNSTQSPAPPASPASQLRFSPCSLTANMFCASALSGLNIVKPCAVSSAKNTPPLICVACFLFLKE